MTAVRLRPASKAFLDELEAKYPAAEPGEISDSMRAAAAATHDRIQNGQIFLVRRERGGMGRR